MAVDVLEFCVQVQKPRTYHCRARLTSLYIALDQREETRGASTTWWRQERYCTRDA